MSAIFSASVLLVLSGAAGAAWTALTSHPAVQTAEQNVVLVSIASVSGWAGLGWAGLGWAGLGWAVNILAPPVLVLLGAISSSSWALLVLLDGVGRCMNSRIPAQGSCTCGCWQC